MKSDDVPTLKNKIILVTLIAMVVLPILAYLTFLVRW
jgi:hypothetical protein